MSRKKKNNRYVAIDFEKLDTIPISVFDKPLYCKKTAIKPLIQQTVNQ